MPIKYVEIELEKINFHGNSLLLLVTATPLETQHLHAVLTPFDTYPSIIKTHNGCYTYYIGAFSNYLAVHVQCGTMGSISRDGSITTVSEAITLFEPKITLMIGVAFGVDETEQNIGDVLISECISPYNFKKVQGGLDILRANDAPASKTLLNRFKSALSWEYFIEETTQAKIINGPILSGEELINDIIRRNALIKDKPTAKGGEMEGAGVYSAADGRSEWILVKGICDFADGNKDRNKEANQKIAIQSAISLCVEVFSTQTAFNCIGLTPVQIQPLANTSISPTKISQVLFDRYDNTKADYYLNRTLDNIIKYNLEIYSLWVYGKSGRGKSNIVLRNIINENLEHILVSLANCAGLSIDEFFKEIYIELASILEPKVKTPPKLTFQKSIKNIVSLLERHYSDKKVYIIIDEIPLGSDENCKVFTDKICSLFISNSLYSQSTKIKYVLSSIYSPIDHISTYNQKIYEFVKFIEVLDWKNPECSDLVNLIEEKLELTIDPEIKEAIISSANGSPRFVKKAFKNSYPLGGLHMDNYKTVLSETKRELNNI